MKVHAHERQDLWHLGRERSLSVSPSSVLQSLLGCRPSLVVTKCIATSKGITTSNKKLLGWRPLLSGSVAHHSDFQVPGVSAALLE